MPVSCYWDTGNWTPNHWSLYIKKWTPLLPNPFKVLLQSLSIIKTDKNQTAQKLQLPEGFASTSKSKSAAGSDLANRKGLPGCNHSTWCVGFQICHLHFIPAGSGVSSKLHAQLCHTWACRIYFLERSGKLVNWPEVRLSQWIKYSFVFFGVTFEVAYHC